MVIARPAAAVSKYLSLSHAKSEENPLRQDNIRLARFIHNADGLNNLKYR